MLVTPMGAMADEYQRAYTTQRSCYKEVYREEYVPGTRSSKGYVKYFSDTLEVPCGSSGGVTCARKIISLSGLVLILNTTQGEKELLEKKKF